MAKFARLLRQHRRGNRLGIREAARRAKISKGLLSSIEHGSDPRVSTFQKVLRAYGLKIEIVYA